MTQVDMTDSSNMAEKTDQRDETIFMRDPEREDTGLTYESVEEHDPTNESGWRTVADKVWKHEKATVAGWNGQIDTLLVFAGLFSAVLTAFNVQCYPALQPSSSPQALLTLPTDLAGHVLISTSPTGTTPPVAVSMIVVNTLWFLALVLSLIAASVGISVKQWLASYIPPATITSRQSTRLWHLRHRGLRRWRVAAIVSMLAVLLQLALMLFLVGLVVLLWTLNVVVAIVVMVPVALLIVLSVLVAILPTFTPDCPFRSPQAWWIYLLLHRLTRFDGTLKKRLFETRRHFLQRVWRTVVVARDWLDRDNNFLRSQTREKISVSALDTVSVLVAADHLVRDDEFLQEVIIPAFDVVNTSQRDFDACLRAFYALVQARAHTAHPSSSIVAGDPPTMHWFRDEMDSGSVAAMADLTLDMLIKVAEDVRLYRTTQARDMSRILAILQALLAALPRSQSRVLLRLIDWYCEEGTTYRPAHAREEDPVEVIAQHAARYRSKIKALPARKQAILGSKAMSRLEQLLQDPASESFRHRQAERGLLRLIGGILDNRQSPVTKESNDVVLRLCRLLGDTTPISQGTRTTLIWLAARVAADLTLDAECLLHLAACLQQLAKEPHNDIRSQNTMCLCTAIEASLDKMALGGELTAVTQQLLCTLRDLLDSVDRLDRYGIFDYLRGILSIYSVLARKQAHFLTSSDVDKLEICVAACTEIWPQDLAEAQTVREKMAGLHRALQMASFVTPSPHFELSCDAV
ncbi:hypothetical protein DAEQUDRAFT_733011 [Daedalea quercina L-15889]|uniref:DUF6535 domain-containing protein n=1 Tax=Daedalea quercina L-15889 TaxID=1314783 RepID=A0A165LA70_9APHY|nr:hypothetical protein DAEQUDRAFT_733011 [Daedalea quercina L-15889]